jgi:hypothetical protein
VKTLESVEPSIRAVNSRLLNSAFETLLAASKEVGQTEAEDE